MEQKNKQKGTLKLMCYLKKTASLKNGEARIYMRISLNKQIVNFSLQGSIEPALWSQAKERSKGERQEGTGA